MKKLKKLKVLSFLFLFAWLFSLEANAQDKQSPWAIGLGTNVIDVKSPKFIKDYFGPHDWNASYALLNNIYVARYLNKYLTLDLHYSLNKVRILPRDIVNNNPGGGRNYVHGKNYQSIILGLRYDLNTLIGDTKWFDPYLRVGFGETRIGNDDAFNFTPGFGFNTWFNDHLGLNFQSSYKLSRMFGSGDIGRLDYIGSKGLFQHTVSLVYKFGKAKDSDGDGVPDKKDLCPEIPGKIELFGCPDSDGDGIADKDDACPNVAGTKEMNGCPDSDGDGIADKDDACPNEAGTKEMNGCPDADADGDGVIDPKDKCPNVAGEAKYAGCPDADKDGLPDNNDKCPNTFGPIENNGCPWPDTDGDGVTDNLDNCVNERGPKDNNGCPIRLTKEAKQKLGKFAKIIEFDSGKSTFKGGVIKTLDVIVDVMKEFKGVRFEVEGHCDSVGSDAKNLKLSQDRAQAVVDYLNSKGVKSWRLNVVGYGETRPIATNKTPVGRALNRRVVLTAIESQQ